MPFIFCSVQASVHSMDMIAYYKSQTLAQRKAGNVPVPALSSAERQPTEILFPPTHQPFVQVRMDMIYIP